jgi:hypothetical protein
MWPEGTEAKHKGRDTPKDAPAWRSAILLEAARNDVFPPHSPAYRGIRTSGGTKYVDYAGGNKELYFLGRDPYELNDRYPAVEKDK